MKKCFNDPYAYCFIRGLIDNAKFFKKAKDEGKKYYITPLTLLSSGKNIGHQNTLVHNVETNTIYRYEPHGWDTNLSSKSMDTYLFKKIKETFFKMNMSVPTFIPTQNIMPKFGQIFDILPGPGRCVIWTQAFLHYRLQYLHLSEADIFYFLGLKHPENMSKIFQNVLSIQNGNVNIVQSYKGVASFIKIYTLLKNSKIHNGFV